MCVPVEWTAYGEFLAFRIEPFTAVFFTVYVAVSVAVVIASAAYYKCELVGLAFIHLFINHTAWSPRAMAGIERRNNDNKQQSRHV